MRQRYAMSIRRHGLGAIQEEEEEPQDDLNSSNDHVEALSEVVIENKPAHIKTNGIEMSSRSPERRVRTLDRSKLEVSYIINIIPQVAQLTGIVQLRHVCCITCLILS